MRWKLALGINKADGTVQENYMYYTNRADMRAGANFYKTMCNPPLAYVTQMDTGK